MNKTLKICLLICFILLFIFSVWAFIFAIQTLKESIEMYQIALSNGFDTVRYKNYIILSCISIALSLTSVFFAILVLIKPWHSYKCTYEEFIEMMNEEKFKKQENRKQKLQQQLNDLNKSE